MVNRPGAAVDPATTGLVLSEPLFNFPAVQSVTEEVIFEEFGFHSYTVAPAPWFSMQHALTATPAMATATAVAAATGGITTAAAAAAGTAGGGGGVGEDVLHPTTAAALTAGAGVIVDAGFSGVSAVPFFEGRLLAGGTVRLNLGGKALTNLLKETVSYRSLNMNEEVVLMEHIKEELCWVSQVGPVEGRGEEWRWGGRKGGYGLRFRVGFRVSGLGEWSLQWQLLGWDPSPCGLACQCSMYVKGFLLYNRVG
jgi:actin-related protein